MFSQHPSHRSLSQYAKGKGLITPPIPPSKVNTDNTLELQKQKQKQKYCDWLSFLLIVRVYKWIYNFIYLPLKQRFDYIKRFCKRNMTTEIKLNAELQLTEGAATLNINGFEFYPQLITDHFSKWDDNAWERIKNHLDHYHVVIDNLKAQIEFMILKHDSYERPDQMSIEKDWFVRKSGVYYLIVSFDFNDQQRPLISFVLFLCTFKYSFWPHNFLFGGVSSTFLSARPLLKRLLIGILASSFPKIKKHYFKVLEYSDQLKLAHLEEEKRELGAKLNAITLKIQKHVKKMEKEVKEKAALQIAQQQKNHHNNNNNQ